MPSNGVGVSHFVDEGEVLDDLPITVDPQSRKWPGRRTSVADHTRNVIVSYVYVYVHINIISEYIRI